MLALEVPVGRVGFVGGDCTECWFTVHSALLLHKQLSAGDRLYKFNNISLRFIVQILRSFVLLLSLLPCIYHASHLWYPPFYTSPMASSAFQH